MNEKKAYIEKDLFAACMFAKHMISDGESPGLANHKAGAYYGYSASEVGKARNQLKQNYKIDKEQSRTKK